MVHCALVHYPVLNKKGEEVASAITNLDLHDLPRCAKTFGVKSVYVVTPVEEQMSLARAIALHWLNGAGGLNNPFRKEAMTLLRLKPSLKEVVEEIEGIEGKRPLIIATTARWQGPVIDIKRLKGIIREKNPVLLLFGTAWGLSPKVFEGVDFVLEPIKGIGPYNHLPVRAASAIIFDRLMGRP